MSGLTPAEHASPAPSAVPEYLDKREAAKLLGLPAYRFEAICKAHGGPETIRLHGSRPRRWLVRRADLIAWAGERAVTLR